MSLTYWKQRNAKRLERSRKGVAARLAKHAAEHIGEPIRVDRVVEITIRDSHRPMTTIRLRCEQHDEGRWGRWRGIGAAHLAPTGIGKLLARYIE